MMYDTIIDEKLIKKILKEWKITDFRIDENDHITNDYAKKELDNIHKKIIDSTMDSTKDDYLEKKYQIERKNVSDYVFSTTMMLYRLCESIYFYFEKYGKKKEKTDDELEVLSKLMLYLLQNYKGVLNSYLADDFLTVIQKNRILYECYVVFMFIQKHPELSEDFMKYKEIIQYQIVRKEDENNLSDKKIIEKIEKLKERWSEQKGNNYGNYGWTNKVIPSAEMRKFEYMVNDLKLDEKLGPMYKMSSDYIHSNPYSVFQHPDKKLTILFIQISTDILVNQINHYVEHIYYNETHITLINILTNEFKKSVLK